VEERFEEFLKERRYLLNVSEATLYWYKASFRAWQNFSSGDPKHWVVAMRQHSLSAVSVNTHICALNVFWKWAGEPIHLPYLKEEQKVVSTLSDQEVAKLLSFKPSGINMKRAHVAALTILDTGIRSSELLGLTKEDINLDDLVMKIHGKGNKQRLVPFTIELRKHLYRYSAAEQKERPRPYQFGTRYDTKVTIRNLERDFHTLGKECGLTGVRPHALRHTFSAAWIRRGGDIFLLSRCLGHSDVSTTVRYLRSLGIEDIRAAHQRVSLLSR
jgi:integrase/recombinase XerD